MWHRHRHVMISKPRLSCHTMRNGAVTCGAPECASCARHGPAVVASATRQRCTDCCRCRAAPRGDTSGGGGVHARERLHRCCDTAWRWCGLSVFVWGVLREGRSSRRRRCCGARRRGTTRRLMPRRRQVAGASPPAGHSPRPASCPPPLCVPLKIRFPIRNKEELSDHKS